MVPPPTPLIPEYWFVQALLACWPMNQRLLAGRIQSNKFAHGISKSQWLNANSRVWLTVVGNFARLNRQHWKTNVLVEAINQSSWSGIGAARVQWKIISLFTFFFFFFWGFFSFAFWKVFALHSCSSQSQLILTCKGRRPELLKTKHNNCINLTTENRRMKSTMLAVASSVVNHSRQYESSEDRQ